MLTKNHIESELSIAYVQAVSAKAGFATEFTRIDLDSVDVTVCGKGKLSADSILHSPKIDIQLKATKNRNINTDGSISFNLPLKLFVFSYSSELFIAFPKILASNFKNASITDFAAF